MIDGRFLGNYEVSFSLGGESISFTPQSIPYFSIASDFDSVLPFMRFSLSDYSGLYTHLFPFDLKHRKMDLSLIFHKVGVREDVVKRSIDPFKLSFFLSKVSPSQYSSGSNLNQSFVGVLAYPDIENIFCPCYSRVFGGVSYKDIFLKIAGECGCFADISDSLRDVAKVVVQPKRNNLWLIRYLTRYLYTDSERGFYLPIFIPDGLGKYKFVLKSYREYLSQKPYLKLYYLETGSKEGRPSFNFQLMCDYSKLYFGMRRYVYSYFDFMKGKYTEKRLGLDDVSATISSGFPLSEGEEYSRDYCGFGRSTEFTDFSGLVYDDYLRKLNLFSAFIDIDFDITVWPGSIVDITFPVGYISESQCSGNWFVWGVEHFFSLHRSIVTRLFLVRAGMNNVSGDFVLSPRVIRNV